MKRLLFTFFFFTTLLTFSQKKDYSLLYISDTIISKGVSLHDEKKYSDAIAEYQKISKVDPNYLKAQSEIALSLTVAENKTELKKLFENLYESGKMKDYPELYIRYGSFLDDENDFENAGKIFKEGGKFLSNNSSYLYNYAVFFIKVDKRQEAIDTLEKLVEINPNYASAHYLLGLLAFENGNITEGALSLITYLVCSPNGRFAGEAIKTLNSKFGDNYTKEGKLVFSKNGDNFKEMNDILRNQFPLNKNYKLKSEIEDVLTRQVQAIVEYSAEHKLSDGFFERNYIPWMKELVKSNQVENLSYYMLLSMENTLGKRLTSQKKKIENFYTNFVPVFWKKITQKTIDFYGKKEDVSIIYNNNSPYLIGKVVNEKKEGNFLYIDESGNKSGDLFFKNNELNGLQKYYYTTGILSSEKTFVDGKIDGVKKTYYENGQLASVENYKDDQLNGLVTTYKINGGKYGELNFANNEKDGKVIFYFSNQTKMLEANYSKNKYNGEVIEYNEVGDITLKANYSDDLLDGKYIKYYDGKKIKSEATYDKGKVVGSFKSYYSNGTLEKETIYVNGKIKKEIEYKLNGKLDQESFYSDDEDRESIVLYNHLGEKFFEEKYKKGELKSGIQYFKNAAPKEINLTKKAFEIFNLDGTKFVDGEFEKGRKTGEWIYYHNNGNVRIKESFKDGKINGIQYNYRKNGNTSVICNYINGDLNGLYEYYDDSGLNNSAYYVNDEKNGPSTNYYPNNKIKKEDFYVDGKLNFVSYSYDTNGNLESKTVYNDNNFTDYEVYNSKGEIETKFSFSNKTGNYSIPFHNGITKSNFTLKNGEYDGKFELVDKFNNKITESNYVNGNLHGLYKHYNPNGSIANELVYYNAQQNGFEKYYDLVGNLRLAFTSSFGNDTGITTRYNNDKTKLYEYNEIEDVYQGEYKWYNRKGENIATIYYENDVPLYYLRLDKQGLLTEKVEIVNQTADVVSNYANGKKAFNLKFVKGLLDGKINVFSAEGREEYSSEYKKNLVEGDRIEYYANGKIYKKEHYKNGNYEGLIEYFKEDGKKWITAEYTNDELNGNVLIYENGILILTKKYIQDELVDIIK
ncbi:hypothetical protein [Flavobacterium sp.]|uniref:hypothetical protein n=1 Tax=Flavobacterium sp. TaxID=239 RepID=UPI002629ECF6|nr:hypothetical protein [Flavobacterium sp.]